MNKIGLRFQKFLKHAFNLNVEACFTPSTCTVNPLYNVGVGPQ